MNSISDNKDIQKFILYETFCNYQQESPYELLKTRQFLFEHNIFQDIRLAVKEQEDFLNNPITVDEGVISCSKCGCNKTLSYTKQIRRSDEGATVFVTCSKCHFKFTM